MAASSSDFDLDALGPSPHIVVVVRDHMSGLLYSIPQARAIRKRFPDAKITLVTSSYCLPILAGGLSYYDQALPLYTFDDEPTRWDRIPDLWAKFRTWLKLVGRVDLVIHLRHVGSGTLPFFAALGRPPQVGFSQGGSTDRLLRVNVGDQDISLGSRQRNTQVLEAIGIPVDSEQMEIEISDGDVSWAKAWLREQGHVESEPVIIVHPGCHWGCNQWLEDRWHETVSTLLEKMGGTAVVTGARREIPLAQGIVDGVDGRILNAAGETTLSQFAALISVAQLVVSVDTAPTQVAQARMIPSVIMMGDGTMSWNGPIDPEPMIMLQEFDPADRPEEVCRWSDGACNGPQCTSRLDKISVVQVLESVDAILARR